MTRLFTWDIRGEQIQVVPFAFKGWTDAYHYADNVFSVITANRDSEGHRLSWGFTKYYFEDPRIIFAARSVLKSFSKDPLDIVAGYVSQNTSAFFTSHSNTLEKLSTLQKDEYDKATKDALDAFFEHDKQGYSLGAGVVEALKYNPNAGVALLLGSILQAFQSFRGYDGPSLTKTNGGMTP